MEKFKYKNITQKMVYIKSGTFLMGSPENEPNRFHNEHQHKAIIKKPFWIADTVCTQELWLSVMGYNPSRFKGSQLPVDSVSWNDCQEFLKKTDLRLPTEIEWEYACRAGTQTSYSTGKSITTDQANFHGNQYRKCTVEVKSFPPNKWELYEMHGNVWEWVEDLYYYYECDKKINIDKPIWRGGSWAVLANDLRSAIRGRGAKYNRNPFTGFRIAKD